MLILFQFQQGIGLYFVCVPNISVSSAYRTSANSIPSMGSFCFFVFSLSLMCDKRSWPKYITEASRCLSEDGLVFIAVPTEQLRRPRLSNLLEVIEENGFVDIKQVEKGEPSFTFIDARKPISTTEKIRQ